ncbi:MAG: Hsp20 family protein [Deltaproteobacteria bacterium]|nr:Hsp20 family protein [Deltaproteobacteria bacterium]
MGPFASETHGTSEPTCAVGRGTSFATECDDLGRGGDEMAEWPKRSVAAWDPFEELGQLGRWVEPTFGSFSRSSTLPADVDTDRVAATFKDGVLRIENPKCEESKPKVIASQS